jgi:hypothetical protein
MTTKAAAGRVRDARSERPPASYAPPWLLGGVIVAAGWGTHWLWGRQLPEAAWATAGILAGTAVLTALTWGYSKARETLLRAHSTVVTALAGLAVMVTTVIGTPKSWLSVEVFGGVLVAISWNVRRLDVIRGEGRDDHGRGDVGDQLGLPGAKFGKAKVTGPKAEVVVRAADGQDYTDVQKAAKQLNALAHLPPNSVRVVPDQDDSSRATFVMVAGNVLRDQLDWPGPSHPGGTMADPLHPGMYEDGEPEQLWLAGNWSPGRGKHVVHRNATHLLVMGMSGSGKTIAALILAVEILTRRHVVLFWVDTVKGLQSARPIEAGIDWLVTDRMVARQLLIRLKDAVAYRARVLGERGFREWWPGCGLPYLVVWIEEAPSVVADSSVITELSERMRSVGMSLVLSMQRASNDRLPPSTAANLGAVMCFGIGDKGGFDDVRFALSDETVAAGAHPEAWGAARPGFHYLEAPGVESDRWSTKARTFVEDDDALARVVAEWAHVRATLDEGTAACFGDAYTSRDQPIAPAAAARPGPQPTEEDDMDDDFDGADDGDEADEDYHAEDGPDDWPIPEQPEPDLAAKVNPRAPIDQWGGDREEVDLGPEDDGRPALTRETKERVFDELLAGFLAAGRAEVRMAEFVEAWFERTGQPASKGRPFLHEMLGQRIDQGQVERAEEGRGVYRLQMLVTAPNGHRP